VETIHPAIDLLQTMFNSIEDVQISDEETAYDKVYRKFPKEVDRIHVLNDYRQMWRTQDVQMIVGSPDPEVDKRVRLNYIYRPRISSWLTKELKRTPTTLQGIITRIKADGKRRYFTMFDEYNKLIKCELTPAQEEVIIGLFKVPIELRGILIQVKNMQSIKELMEIEELAAVKITPTDYPALISPLELTVTYNADKENWTVENEVIGLRTVAESLDEAKREVLVLLDFMVDRYLIQSPGETLSPELIQSIEELRKVVNPANRTDEEHWTLEE
jgi:hypothetical protein